MSPRRYEVISQGNTVLDVLESGGLRVEICRTGAEMVSLSIPGPDGSRLGFLHRDGDTSTPASGWANHATVMGYFLHRLWKEQTRYRNQVITGGNHGFLRHFQFEAPAQGENSLTYSVPVDQVPHGAYPLRVSLELTYRIVADALQIEFVFTNHEPDLIAHVSFGLHPGFFVSSVESCRVLMPAGDYRRYRAPGNFLSGETEDIPFAGGEMPFSKKELPGSYLLDLSGVPKRVFVVEDPVTKRRIELDFQEVPYLTLWSDMGQFVCVEPCWGLPDSVPQKAFEDKVGIQTIAPLAKLSGAVTLRPTVLS